MQTVNDAESAAIERTAEMTNELEVVEQFEPPPPSAYGSGLKDMGLRMAAFVAEVNR